MKIKISQAVLSLLLAFSFVASPSVVGAADSVSELTPNNLYERIIKDISNKIKSANFESFKSISFYEESLDDEPYSLYAVEAEGMIKDGSNKSPLADSRIKTRFTTIPEEGDGFEIETEFIATKGEVFVMFPKGMKGIKKKWISVPLDKYDALGEVFGISGAFGEGIVRSGSSEDAELLNLTLKLAKKHNLFTHFPYDVNDNTVVKKATRYNLTYNRDSIAPFYLELLKNISPEQKEKSVFVIPSFETNLSNPDFLDYMADHSYVSLWFDDKTMLPARFREVVTFPTKGNNRNIALMINDTLWTKQNKTVNVKKPSKTITMQSALDLLGLSLPGTTDNEDSDENPLEVSLRNYEQAISKDDKMLAAYYVAVNYDALENYAKSAEYYMIAASHAQKKSADYYMFIAEAEWSKGNGSKVIENYELALMKDPNHMTAMYGYGMFLLGLHETSVNHQDLNRALTLNKKLLTKEVSDYVLSSLFANYVLLGDLDNAETTKSRFDNFNTADNYSWVARAYHRAGNKDRTAYYNNLARAMGYVQGEGDKIFFAMKF